MMNGANDVLEAKVADRNERAKKLYRYVSDVARRIDEATLKCQSVTDHFSTKLEVLRQKLRDNCEKLLFLDPLNHGKKGLELLWRKVYYEPVSVAKKNKQADQSYDQILFTHMMCGIGHFHHIITRIQMEMNIHIKEMDYNMLYIGDEETKDTKLNLSDEEIQFGCNALHICLIYLGDLSRYQVELFNTFDPSIAARYYLQAAHIDMSSGMPYNQLGNLYLDRNYNLDSVCYYIHCLSCVTPFEGAMGNLTKIFEKFAQYCELENEIDTISQMEHIQNTIGNFLSLIELWFLNKSDTNIPQRCNTIIHQLKIAMDFTKPSLPDVNKNYTEYSHAVDEDTTTPSYLNGNIIHKIVQICLFTMARINEIDESKTFACKALTLAIFSQLLQKQLQQLREIGLKSPAYKYTAKVISVTEINSNNIKNQDVPTIPQNLIVSDQNIITDIDKPLVNGNKETHDTNNIIEDCSDQEGKKLQNDATKINNKKTLTKRRRRRRLASSESSDLSDAETDTSEVESDESSTNEHYSGEDDDFSDSSNPSEDDCKNENNYINNPDAESKKSKENIDVSDANVIDSDKIVKEVSQKSTLGNIEHPIGALKNNKNKEIPNIQEVQNFLYGDNILPTIKLLIDWIIVEKDLILSCGESGESLFQCVVDMLNIFMHHFVLKNDESLDKCDIKVLEYAKWVSRNFKYEYKTIPLPEDVSLRGTIICKFDKDAAEWQILDRYKPSIFEENMLRILLFIDFGNQLSKIVPRIRFNRSMKIFYLKKIAVPKLHTKLGHKRNREWHNSKIKNYEGKEGLLMRRLGRLWLASRVRELDRERAALAGPAFLALDAPALHKHLRRVQILLRSCNFTLLVPTVVLQELDDLKREQSSARDAIRWLELQLKSGSRFLRAQRPGQSKPLPLLKYPRKAPPRVHNYIQILEFCNHFIIDDKHNQGGNGDPNGKSAPMLILLVGSEFGDEEGQFKDFSLTGAAQASGITVEYIGDFYMKWRQKTPKSSKKR